MLAAFRLAVQKSDGRVIVTGDPEFRERTFAMAVRYGLADALADPDLAQRWRALRPPLPQPDHALAGRVAPPPAAAVAPSPSPVPTNHQVEGAKNKVPASSVEAVPAASPSANVIKRRTPQAKSPAEPEPLPHATVPHRALAGRATPPPAAAVRPSPSLAPTDRQVQDAKDGEPDLALPDVDQSKRRKTRDANPPRLSKGPSDIDFPPGFLPHGRGAGR